MPDLKNKNNKTKLPLLKFIMIIFTSSITFRPSHSQEIPSSCQRDYNSAEIWYTRMEKQTDEAFRIATTNDSDVSGMCKSACGFKSSAQKANLHYTEFLSCISEYYPQDSTYLKARLKAGDKLNEHSNNLKYNMFTFCKCHHE